LMSVLEENFGKVQEDQVRRIGAFLTESIEVPQTAILEGRMRANAIRQVIEGGTWLTALQIAAEGGFSPSNPAEPASRWKREGKIFSIPFKGQDLYAAYQFDDDLRPRPVVAKVLKLFRQKKDPWKIAAWFAAENGWLGGVRPLDCLEDPGRVTDAAEHELSGINE